MNFKIDLSTNQQKLLQQLEYFARKLNPIN